MSLAKELESYFDRLWSILRSITGEGVRQTHDILAELVQLERTEIPSGTQVFDWTIPKEWKVNEAYIIDPNGKRILDVKENTFHLVTYSFSRNSFKERIERTSL
jgi:aminopeptidase-like protein